MQVFNPYLPSYEYIPDGEPHIFGDRLYVYGSHDKFNGNGFCEGDYMCYSAPLTDLGNWRCDGVIYRRSQDPENSDGKWTMNAPDVIQGYDGRYYLYYQISVKMNAGCAVSDKPTGPFEFYGYVKYPDGHAVGTKKKEIFCFDPGALRDDDGRIYLFMGFSPTGLFRTLMRMRGSSVDGGYGAELDKDMLTVKDEPKLLIPGPAAGKGTTFEGHEFFEASSVKKINGLYYYVYSSILSHELCYAVSDKVFGPYTYGGTLVSIGDLGLTDKPLNSLGNTHGGMEKINGDWYIFYHRQTNKQKCCRQGCAEKLVFDGNKILQSEITSCGLNNGPLEGKGKYEARIACILKAREGVLSCTATREKDKKNLYPYFTQSGNDREDNPDQYIANMRDGSVAGFKYFSMNSPKKITVEIRGKGTGKINVYSVLANGEPDKNSLIASAGFNGSDEYIKVSADITKEISGKTALYFEYEGSGFIDFNSFELR